MSTIVLPPRTVARLRQRRKLSPTQRALRSLRTVERRRLVAAASGWRSGLPAVMGNGGDPNAHGQRPVLTARQRQIVASAVAAQRLDDLRADTADARRALARIADELADRVDPQLRRRREARLRADAVWERVHGVKATA